jgi:hypothetical protein
MTVPVMQSPSEISQRLLKPGQAPFLGVVMLDTRFPRPVGDLGNLATWPVPVNIRVVRGIWPDKVVQSAAGLHAGRVRARWLSPPPAAFWCCCRRNCRPLPRCRSSPPA